MERKTHPSTGSLLPNLPLGIWDAEILTRLEAYDHAHLSLVCRDLCLLLRRGCRSLRLSPEVQAEDLSGVIARRPFLRELDLTELRSPSHAILEAVTRSSVSNLQCLTMPKDAEFPNERQLILLSLIMRKLRVFRIRVTKNNELIALSKTLPLLEELEVSRAVTDECVEEFLPKFRNLRRIKLSQSCALTDRSLVALSSSDLLDEVCVSYCLMITHGGVAYCLRKCRNLTCIRFTGVNIIKEDVTLTVLHDAIPHAKKLKQIEFELTPATARMLASAAAAALPLTSVKIHHETRSRELTEAMFDYLRHRGANIRELRIDFNEYASHADQVRISEILRDSFVHLPNLACFEATGCVISKSQLFTLIHRCPSLQEIRIFSPHYQNDAVPNSPENRSVRSLVLHPTRDFGSVSKDYDAILKGFAICCPQLQTLQTGPVHDSCIFENILKKCPKLRHLNIAKIVKGALFSSYSRISVPALRNLEVYKSRLDDTDLDRICKRCPNLVRLNLDNLWLSPLAREYLRSSNRPSVTVDGLIRLARKCKKLTKLSLYTNEIAASDQVLLQEIVDFERLKGRRPPLRIEVSDDSSRT